MRYKGGHRVACRLPGARLDMDPSTAFLLLLLAGCFFGTPIAVGWLIVRVRQLERELAVLRKAKPAPQGSSIARDDPWEAPEARLGEPERPAAVIAEAVLEPSLPAEPTTRPASTAAGSQPLRAPSQGPEGIPGPEGLRTPEGVRGTETSPSARIEWERWLGVRGAGVLGGVFAALAAVLLFRHAIQEGWITPAMRVGLGLLAGLVLAGIGERLRPRGYRYAPEGLIGAGAVAHYASIWAAGELYGFWPLPVSFALMALVTAAACVLALRHRSSVIALIGLLGGFATPLLLATAEDRPLGFFGYLLLLNLGLLMVGRRLVAPWIGLAALAGTALLQALWFGARYRPGNEVFALAMLALFAALFAFQPRSAARARSLVPTQAAGLLLPFLFALHVSSRGGLELDLAPLALFAGLLLAAACVLARQKGLEQLATGAAAGALALLLSWRLGRDLDPPAAWGLAIAVPLLAAVPHAFLVIARRRASGPATPAGLGAAASLLTLGLGALLVTVAVAPSRAPFAALVAAFAALAAIAWVRAWLGAGAPALPALAVLSGLGLTVHLSAQRAALAPSAAGAALGLLGLAALLHLGAKLLREPGAREIPREPAAPDELSGGEVPYADTPHAEAPRDGSGRTLARRLESARDLAWLAAALYPLLPLIAQERMEPLGGPASWARLATVGLLALLALAAALRAGWTPLLGAALGASTLALHLPHQAVLSFSRAAGEKPWGTAGSLLALGLVLAAAFALAPRFGRRPSASRPVLWIAGLAPLLLCLALTPSMRGLGWYAGQPWHPASFALVAALTTSILARRFPEARSSHGLPAVLLAAWALSRWIAIEPPLVFLGLTAAGAALLGWRTGHAWVLIAGVVAVLAALLLTAQQLLSTGHYPRSGSVLLNGLAFAHATAFLGAALLAGVLARREAERAGDLEAGTAGPRPWGGALAGLSAAGILFLWLTLTVMEIWSTGARVAFPHPRVAAFDLTLSLAWTAYGLALLGFGLWRRSAGARWASLFVLLLAIGKVFLRDLGDLEGLSRVASLAGLALSLTLVSLLYQRFVFGRAAPAGAE